MRPRGMPRGARRGAGSARLAELTAIGIRATLGEDGSSGDAVRSARGFRQPRFPMSRLASRKGRCWLLSRTPRSVATLTRVSQMARCAVERISLRI